MHAILITADLMTASQVAATAASAGVTLETADSVSQAVAKLQQNGASLVVLDLSAPAVAPAELVTELRTLESPPKIVAFGPHVHVEKLRAAREAGCDEVLTRGQFYAQMDDVLRRGA